MTHFVEFNLINKNGGKNYLNFREKYKKFFYFH